MLFLSCYNFCATLLVLQLCTNPFMLQMWVVFLMLQLLSWCCFSCTTPLTLQLCVVPFMLQLLSRCHSSCITTPFTLFFSPCYFSHVVVPLALFFSHYGTFQTHVSPTFVVLLVLPLLLLLHSYSILFG